MAHVQKTYFYLGNHGMYIWVHSLCWETERSIKNEIFNKWHYWKHYVSVWQLRFTLSRVNCQYFEMNFSYSTPNTLSRGTISPGSRKYMGIISFGDSHLFSLWPYKSLCPTSSMWNCCVCVDSDICLSDGVCHSDLMFRSVWTTEGIYQYFRLQLILEIYLLSDSSVSWL